MSGTSSPESVSTRLQRVAKLSREAPGMVWTTLAHLIDIELLKEAYRLTRKNGAVGVDGQTAQEYAENLEDNLKSLLARFKSGTYKAPPVRRVHIPKGDGKKTRPIGIPTFEDKVLQRAVVMVLESVYEQDFLDCSFGFRPGRSPHQALEYLRNELWKMRGGFVLEVDLRSFFDTLDHGHLRKILDKRVRDGVMRRAIDKWLKAGVLEGGAITRNDTGSPQGGVVSPILSNIFLNEVLDRWFEHEVKPRLYGPAFLVRYADDFVVVFADLRDAQRVLEVLPKRLGRFGLEIHPDKDPVGQLQASDLVRIPESLGRIPTSRTPLICLALPISGVDPEIRADGSLSVRRPENGSDRLSKGCLNGAGSTVIFPLWTSTNISP